MSQHTLLDRPDRRVLLGWDHPLQSFFGVVLDADDMAVDGWPTNTGLGTHRPAATDAQAVEDLARLLTWARGQIADELAACEAAEVHLCRVMSTIAGERRHGRDGPEIPVPACLQGAKP